jgi:hypothetical protein
MVVTCSACGTAYDPDHATIIIGGGDRAEAMRALPAALRKRKGAKRGQKPADYAAFDPFNRPESPIRAMILDNLAAALPTVAARRGQSRRP